MDFNATHPYESCLFLRTKAGISIQMETDKAIQQN